MDTRPDRDLEELVLALLRVLDHFRDCDPDALLASIAMPGAGAHWNDYDDNTHWLSYGDLRALAEGLVAERARANRAARYAADSSDLLAAVREELEDLRERYADLATERDVLAVELDEVRRSAERTMPGFDEVNFHPRPGDDEFRTLDNWDPAKPGVLVYYDHGDFVPFCADLDAETLPRILTYYDDLIQALDEVRARYASLGRVEEVSQVDEDLSTLRNARGGLRAAYEAVRFSFARTGLRHLTRREEAP